MGKDCGHECTGWRLCEKRKCEGLGRNNEQTGTRERTRKKNSTQESVSEVRRLQERS